MKKTIWVIAALIVMAGAITFVACSKENEKADTLKETSATPAPKTQDAVLIGKLVDGHIICGVNVDEFSEAIWNETDIYVAEKFEILDTFPELQNGTAYVNMVLFNVEEEGSEAYWFPIEKINGDYLCTANAASGGLIPYCKRTKNNPCTKTCVLKKDKYGNPIACQCEGPGATGTCDMYFQKEEGFWDKVGDAMRNLSENIRINIDIDLNKLFR